MMEEFKGKRRREEEVEEGWVTLIQIQSEDGRSSFAGDGRRGAVVRDRRASLHRRRHDIRR